MAFAGGPGDAAELEVLVSRGRNNQRRPYVIIFIIILQLTTNVSIIMVSNIRTSTYAAGGLRPAARQYAARFCRPIANDRMGIQSTAR